MATDMQRLVVSLEATSKKFESAMAKALGTANSRARAIESRFAKMNSKLGNSLAGVGKQWVAGLAAGVTAGAFAKFSDAATRIDNSLKVAGLSGEDLTQVYERLRNSAIKNAAPIESLVELYSRASLSAKELGVSQDQLLSFTDKIAVALRVNGKSAEESSGALLQLSQLLGAGTVRAEEFSSVQEGALPILQAVSAGLKEAGGSVAELRKLVIDGKVSSQAFFNAFEAGSSTLEEKVSGSTFTISQAFENLQTSLTDAVYEFNRSTGASERFAGGINNVAQAISDFDVSSFIAKIKEAGGELETFLGNVGNSSFFKSLSDFMADRPLDPDKPITLETLEAERKLAGLKYQIEIVQALIEHNKEMSIDTSGAQAELADLLKQAQAVQATIGGASAGPRYVPGTPGDPNALAQQSTLPPATVKTVSIKDFPASGSGSGKKTRQNDFQREKAQIIERTAALQAETAAMAGLNPLVNDYGYAVEKARAIVELETAATKAKLKLTPELKASIETLAEGYAQASVEAEKLAERQDRVREAAGELRDTAKDVFSGFISDMRSGKSAAEALQGALNKVLDKLIEIGINALFGGGIGAGGNAFGLIGKLFGFADGGYTGSGAKQQPAGVVHKGEYVFSKKATDRIGVGNLEAMHNNLKGFAEGGAVGMPSVPSVPSGGGGPSKVHVTVGVDVDKSGNLMPFVTSVSTRQAAQVVREARPQLSKDAVNSVQHASRQRPGLFR